MPQLRPDAAKQINIKEKKAQELKTKNHEQVECGLTYIIESEASFQAGRDFRHYLNQTCKLAQAWRPKACHSLLEQIEMLITSPQAQNRTANLRDLIFTSKQQINSLRSFLPRHIP